MHPASPRPFEPITYRMTVTNSGADAVGAFSVGVYLDAAPGTCDGNAQHTATVNGLAAGASTTVELVEPLGFDSPGSHNVYAQVDNGCRCRRPARTTRPGRWHSPSRARRPNPTWWSTPSARRRPHPAPNVPVTVTVTVRNHGEAYVESAICWCS